MNNIFKNNVHTNDKIKQEIDYFIAGPGKEADRMANAETTLKIHDKYSDVFTEIWCFKDTFSSQVKDDIKPYMALPITYHSICTKRTIKKS